MADALTISSQPELRRPLLIAAWSGWNDAGESATGAIRFMLRRWREVAFASIDPEPFYDFTQARPRVRLQNGERVLDWPANEFYAHRAEGDGQDLILFLGIEPHLQWHTYAQAVIEICRRFDVSGVLTLGALLAEASHSRPIRVMGSSEDTSMRERLHVDPPQRPGYQGPTGIVGVVNGAAREAGFATASMWANVPYYVSASPNPKGSLALLQSITGALDLGLRLHDLEIFAARFDAQVAEEVAKNPNVAEFARRIEESDEDDGTSTDVAIEPAAEDLPDADVMVEELERFLRQQRDEPDGKN